MARGKLALEFVAKDKARKTTFEKRKKGLMKKAEEFSILCGVDTCVILYGPADSPGCEPMIWPQDPEKVKQVIHRYVNEGADWRDRRAVGLPEFFMSRKRKIENELAKVRSANLAAKFPVSDELLNGLSQDQIQIVMSVLVMKLENAKKRLLAAKENTAMNISSIVPIHMDEFKFNSSVHSHIDDYMQMDLIKPPLDFQQPMISPYLHPLMNGSMNWPHVEDSSVGTGSSSSSCILANHQSYNYYYNFAPTIQSYNGSFPQSAPLPTYQSMPHDLDQCEQMRGAQPTPASTKFNSSGQGVLGTDSTRMMLPLLQRQPQMHQYPMVQPGNTNPSHLAFSDQRNMNSSTFAAPDLKAQFHGNGDRVYQFFAPKGGNH